MRAQRQREGSLADIVAARGAEDGKPPDEAFARADAVLDDEAFARADAVLDDGQRPADG